MLFRIQGQSGAGKSEIVRGVPRHPDEISEDKVAIGGPGLVAARKPKAGISV